MTDRHAAIAEAITDLTWLVTIPHTIDQIIGIYAEHLGAAGRPMRHGLTNGEIMARITKQADSRGQKGGHSDPTAEAALYGFANGDDSDETLGTIDGAIDLAWRCAEELDDLASDAVGVARWSPPEPARRQAKLQGAIARLHHCQPHLDAGLAQSDGHAAWLVGQISDNATWLHGKALGIWEASRGEQRIVAVQRRIDQCSRCAPWRTGTIAGSTGLCEQCRTFQQQNKCLPTEFIVRRWDIGKAATPGQILEARAQASKPGRKARSVGA